MTLTMEPESKFNAAYWDKVAGAKEFATPLPLSAIEARVDRDHCVVDFGCGYGRALKALSDRGYRNLFGIESSQEMATLAARELGSAATIRHCTQVPTPFSDGSVDAVLLFAVLTSILDPQEEQTVCREIDRILKPGGLIFLNENTISPLREDRYERTEDDLGEYATFVISTGDARMKHSSEERLRRCFALYEPLFWQTKQWTSMNGNPDEGIVGVLRKGGTP